MASMTPMTTTTTINRPQEITNLACNLSRFLEKQNPDLARCVTISIASSQQTFWERGEARLPLRRRFLIQIDVKQLTQECQESLKRGIDCETGLKFEVVKEVWKLFRNCIENDEGFIDRVRYGNFPTVGHRQINFEVVTSRHLPFEPEQIEAEEKELGPCLMFIHVNCSDENLPRVNSQLQQLCSSS